MVRLLALLLLAFGARDALAHGGSARHNFPPGGGVPPGLHSPNDPEPPPPSSPDRVECSCTKLLCKHWTVPWALEPIRTQSKWTERSHRRDFQRIRVTTQLSDGNHEFTVYRHLEIQMPRGFYPVRARVIAGKKVLVGTRCEDRKTHDESQRWLKNSKQIRVRAMTSQGLLNVWAALDATDGVPVTLEIKGMALARAPSGPTRFYRLPGQRLLAVFPVRRNIDEVVGAVHYDRRGGRLFTTISAEHARRIYGKAIDNAAMFAGLQRFADHLIRTDKRVMFVFPQKSARADAPSKLTRKTAATAN